MQVRQFLLLHVRHPLGQSLQTPLSLNVLGGQDGTQEPLLNNDGFLQVRQTVGVEHVRHDIMQPLHVPVVNFNPNLQERQSVVPGPLQF